MKRVFCPLSHRRYLLLHFVPLLWIRLAYFKHNTEAAAGRQGGRSAALGGKPRVAQVGAADGDGCDCRGRAGRQRGGAVQVSYPAVSSRPATPVSGKSGAGVLFFERVFGCRNGLEVSNWLGIAVMAWNRRLCYRERSFSPLDVLFGNRFARCRMTVGVSHANSVTKSAIPSQFDAQ